MIKYIYFITILSISVLITNYIDPVWRSYIDYINKIDNLDLRSLICNVFVPWTLSLITYWSLGMAFMIIEKYKTPTSLYETKYQKDAEIKNTISLKTCIKQVIFNQIFALLPGMYILNLVGSIQISSELPSTITMIFHLFLSALLGELFYYFSHRLLHIPMLYSSIHKIHHNYKAPIAIVSLYGHPLEILFGNTFAVIGPIYILNVHSYTLYLGIVLGFVDSLSDHAGFDVKNRFHDLHHQFTNCNFGSIGIFDRVCGTYRNLK